MHKKLIWLLAPVLSITLIACGEKSEVESVSTSMTKKDELENHELNRTDDMAGKPDNAVIAEVVPESQ